MFAGIRTYFSALMGGVLDLVDEVGIEVVNKTGGTLTKGTLVYVSGWDTGGFEKPLISKADHADPRKQAEYVLLEDILTNKKGVANKRGLLGGLVTTGGTVGAAAWMSGSTLGTFSVISRGDAQRVGTIKTVHATNGVIWFDIQPRPAFSPVQRRYHLRWVAGQRGKPGINADIQNAAEATREIADPDFEVLGSNGSSDDVTFNAEGGIKIETDGGGTDSVIILPHLDANQSAWSQVTWGTDRETHWACHIKTGSSIANTTIWAGLKLTNTDVTATDNDQAFFRYQNGVNSGKWQAIYSIGGTDTAGDSGIAAAADTEYLFEVKIDASRIARFYINGVLVGTSTALTDTTDLIPYIGILEGAAAAKHMYIYGQEISRAVA